MSFQPSPNQERRARRRLVRSIALWLPVFALFSAGTVFFLIQALTEDSGAWIGFAILALISLLTLPLLIAALQDLRAEPIETEGQLARKWRKSDFIIAKAHYFLIGKRVFRVEPQVWLEMPDVPGRVHLLHYPHTNTLIDWRPSDTDAEVGPTPAARPWRAVPAAATPPPSATSTPPSGTPPGSTPVELPSFGSGAPPRRVEPAERPARRVDPPRFGGPPPDPDA